MAKHLLLPIMLISCAASWVALRPYNAVREIDEAYRLLRTDRSLVEWSGGQPDATHVRTSATSAARVYRFAVSRGDASCRIDVQFAGVEPASMHPEIIDRQGDCVEPQRLGQNTFVP